MQNGYDFRNPSQVIQLPGDLLEISGISYIRDEVIASVEDEDALIYFLDLKAKKILSTVRFGQAGDYEDLVFTGEYLYVLKSNGNIFKLRNSGKDEEAVEIQTGLSKQYDAEGLCFDRQRNRLLIACKEGEKKSKQQEKFIFAFDLKTETLSESPEVTFRSRDIQRYVKHNQKQLSASFAGKGKEEELFTPSGIAIHPITHQLYVLSSANHLLLVSDLKGNISNIIILSKDLFTQPEGITFSPEGKLYISNEGKKKPANIIGYEYRGN